MLMGKILGWILLQLLFVGGAAWQWGPWHGLTISMLISVLWMLWDARHMQRLHEWLQHGQLQEPLAWRGAWRMLATRIRRTVRSYEQQAVLAEQRVQGILDALQASPNGFVLLDKQGHIQWCNRMAERHFGFDLKRDLYQTIGNLVRDPAFSNYWAAQDFSRHVQMVGRESSATRPVVLSVQIFPYGQERYLLLAQDITTLEQAEAMRRDFVANVSHEIRTPLTVLVGFVETLQTLSLSAQEQHYYLQLMGQQAHRMQNLVQDLLTLSHLEGSPLPSSSEWVPVAQLLQQCEVEAKALSSMLNKNTCSPAHEITFPENQSPAMRWDIAGAQAELLSAFSNLISNALRYTPAGGSVQVRWEVLPDGEGGRLTVEDSGPGIDPAHIGRLTERFYRIDRSRSRDTGGTGLGLAIVKHALQRHSAKLEIQSVLGQGATFVVTFPAQRLRCSVP